MSALADHRSEPGDDILLDQAGSEAADPDSPDNPAVDVPAADMDAPEGESADIEPAPSTTGGPEDAAEDPDDAGSHVVQDDAAASPAQLRVDFGAHLEANYQRLVAQLFAITLDPGEAHDVVQDAYSRAWRSWAVISRSPDPTVWVRRVAVRSTIRSWRRVLSRVGIARPRPVVAGVDARTGALLAALGRLPAAERRCVVLFHMAGMSLGEIAALEQASPGSVHARLSRARQVVTEGMADVLPAVLGLPAESLLESYEVNPYVDEGIYR